MNWINTFELMCYIIVAIMLIDCIHKKDYNALFTFGAAAIVAELISAVEEQEKIRCMRA